MRKALSLGFVFAILSFPGLPRTTNRPPPKLNAGTTCSSNHRKAPRAPPATGWAAKEPPSGRI